MLVPVGIEANCDVVNLTTILHFAPDDFDGVVRNRDHGRDLPVRRFGLQLEKLGDELALGRKVEMPTMQV